MSLLGRRLCIAAVIVLAGITAIPVGTASGADLTPPTLVDIRAAHYPGYDRIVFEFAGGRPDAATVRWATSLRQDPSNKAAHVQGNAFLRVTFQWAMAHDPDPPMDRTFGPARRAFDLPNVAQVVLLGDYEAEVSLGVGLMKRTKILKVIELNRPYRLVVHVATAFPKARVKVFFVDRAALVAGQEPSVVPVMRTVPKGRRARGALQRLYAGPTPAERAAGLRFIPSASTGFRDLRVNDRRIARVVLTGPCRTGGSALVTVADQIQPTLRARPAIRWIKIYDRLGDTQRPFGTSDSIPACLEP